MTKLELAKKIEEEGQKVDENLGLIDAADQKLMGNGLSVVLSDGTLVHGEDDMSKIGPKEAALQKAREDDLTIPAALERTKGMSKEDLDKLHDKLGIRKKVTAVTKAKVAPPAKPSNLTDADKKAIAELKKAEKAAADEKKKAGLAKLAAAKAEKKAVKDAAKANGPVKPQGSPPVAAKPKAVAKTTPKAKPTTSLAKPLAGRVPNAQSEARKGSKTELAGNLIRREEGCTTADILKATDWPSVSVPAIAKAVGIGLRKEKDGKITRYFAC